MTDELFLMAFCCINSDYTHLLLKATITAKSHLGKAWSGVENDDNKSSITYFIIKFGYNARCHWLKGRAL